MSMSDATLPWTADEIMTIAASRSLQDGMTCFVGIGIPSTAAILARSTHAPNLILVYESGPVGAKPLNLPLSIGDGELAETALTVVSIPEMFNYWLQPGRIDIGFLGAAQVDRFGNINTTIIGDDYNNPKVRLPGGGGAPEIAASCKQVTIICRQSRRTFMDRVDFITSMGHGTGRGDREALGMLGAGPTQVITDLGIMSPDPETGELVLSALHPHVSIPAVQEATGWPLRVSDSLEILEEPTAEELQALRSLTTGSVSASA
jgi:glutaconate CoA-transferase, subunit B